MLLSFQISGPTCTSYKHTVCAQPYKKAHTAHARGRQRRRAGRVDRCLPTFSWQAITTPSTRAAGERTLPTRSDRLRPNLRNLIRAAPPLLPRPNRPERAAPLNACRTASRSPARGRAPALPFRCRVPLSGRWSPPVGAHPAPRTPPTCPELPSSVLIPGKKGRGEKKTYGKLGL